jgi:hypothetical protein
VTQFQDLEIGTSFDWVSDMPRSIAEDPRPGTCRKVTSNAFTTFYVQDKQFNVRDSEMELSVDPYVAR